VRGYLIFHFNFINELKMALIPVSKRRHERMVSEWHAMGIHHFLATLCSHPRMTQSMSQQENQELKQITEEDPSGAFIIGASPRLFVFHAISARYGVVEWSIARTGRIYSALRPRLLDIY